MTSEKIPDSDVKVKISSCQKCSGIVRAAVEHAIDEKQKREFFREVMKYDLSVSTISLSEYRSNCANWCGCDKK